jgi:uncharacterized protein (DUF1800 family)
MKEKKRRNQAERSLAKSLYPVALCAALSFIALARSASAQNTIAAEDAIRFLEQTSFGANWTEIQNVQTMGYAGYLQAQFNTPPSGWLDRGLCPGDPNASGNPCTPFRDFYTMYPVQVEFFNKALTAPDQLRQRVVFALDQMWVISANLQGNFQASWMDYYLQILENNAFGNWRQLMQDVTLSPGMGRYLDMSGNFFVSGRAANENYAREILQLFNVGLDELYDDGTPVLDGQGNRVPTYTQDIVVGFSKAFTGWRLQADFLDGTYCLADPPNRRCPNWRDPMQPVNPTANHDHTDKLLLDSVILPARPEDDPACAGGCVSQDLNDALDNIFYNHNTPVYACKNFIRYLVTSNPSGQYVYNCVAAFVDNGQGVRGDMQAVLTAILMDPEARNAPDPTLNPDYGKLREPVLAITNILRNFGVDGSPCSTTGNPCTDFVFGDAYIPGNLRMDEDVFRSPTVFNFFPPDFVITGTDPPLYGPEFAILSTTTELARINMMNALIYAAMGTSTDRPYGTRIDPAQLALYYTGDDGALVDGLGQIMMHGTMSPEMRNVLVNQISAVTDPTAKAQKVAYLIATSSSYNVQR